MRAPFHKFQVVGKFHSLASSHSVGIMKPRFHDNNGVGMNKREVNAFLLLFHEALRSGLPWD